MSSSLLSLIALAAAAAAAAAADAADGFCWWPYTVCSNLPPSRIRHRAARRWPRPSEENNPQLMEAGHQKDRTYLLCRCWWDYSGHSLFTIHGTEMPNWWPVCARTCVYNGKKSQRGHDRGKTGRTTSVMASWFGAGAVAAG